jgi:purine-nucleoside phosphorylase
MMSQAVANPAEKAVSLLREMSSEVPQAAFVLGSGVKVLEDLPESKSVTFQDVFGIAPGVAGHAGSISLGRVDGRLVAVLRGRFHLYEGHKWEVVTLATRVLADWGVPRLYLTNAAGGLNSSFDVGDLMVLLGYRDLLNPNYAQTGLLPALRAGVTSAHNALTKHLLAVGDRLAKSDPSFRFLQGGVYAGLLGPSYETLSEIEMLKLLGADAVGMSTVPELEAARQTQMKAAALSVITNVWKPDEAIGGHEEVLHAAKQASERLDKLFRAVVTDSKLP